MKDSQKTKQIYNQYINLIKQNPQEFIKKLNFDDDVVFHVNKKMQYQGFDLWCNFDDCLLYTETRRELFCCITAHGWYEHEGEGVATDILYTELENIFNQNRY